ncbi:Transcriptional activator flo8 [Tulasnella sp. 424]|nr:Transcriptional activator flo8 [Tulasnella sp. 424]KAG8974750.1 Transcriptional activator flo8 [Tulasnella sp. 425]
MAQPPQQGPPAVSLLMQPSSSVAGASTASNGGSPSMQPTHNGRAMNNWDGDRMLHVYMIDYCRKRGYNAVVNTLCAQTGNTSDVKAPIDAPQGLLFEWWVVFWEIFTAKSEDDPKKNAVAYLQDQRAKNYRPMPPADVKPPIGVQMAGHNFNGPHPPPAPGSMMGPGHLSHFQGHPPGHPNQQPPGMQPMPTPNGVLPPGQQQHGPQPPGAPTPGPPPSQQPVNGPQPYPPQPQSQQPPHPNPANGPQGPPPNQGPGVPQQMGMGNRPGGQNGPQIAMSGQRPGLGGMPNGQGGHQPFAGSPLGPGAGQPGGGPQPSPRTSHMGPPQGLRGHPQQQGQHPQQQQQQGGPANAPTPGGSNMVNGMGPNQTPLMAAQQFMSAGRPGSRSGTPGSQVGGGNQPGVGMSPSRTGGPPGPPGTQARPASQMGGQQPPSGGQGSPFTGPMPGPPSGFSGSLTPQPQVIDQAMRALGYINKTQDMLTPDERNKLHNFLAASVHPQGQRQPGMGTPRMASGGNSMMPGGSQPGQPGPQGGMHGPNFPQQQQFPQSQQMMGQPGQQMMKRPGSPSMQMDASNNESSPPERKRLRKDSQNGTPTSMPGFAPGAPGANGMPGQQPMPNGAGNPGMMRPPPGGPGNPGQTMNPMMVNGGPHGPGPNPMQMRGPQQTAQRGFQMAMGNKPGGLMANPNASGLPIHVKNEPGNMDLQQQGGNPGARGPQPKVHPSPSIPNAKASGSMPPPSHTPNPSQSANKSGIKEEDGTAKSSPSMKAASQNPPTPVQNAATPATQNPNLGSSIFNSTISPSPSSILSNMNQSTPPNNASRPGSSANLQPTNSASGFSFAGADMYPGDFATSLLDGYGFSAGPTRTDDDPGMGDLDFLSQFLNPNAVGSLGDEDITAATAGNSI